MALGMRQGRSENMLDAAQYVSECGPRWCSYSVAVLVAQREGEWRESELYLPSIWESRCIE